jgi:hypothetical protein
MWHRGLPADTTGAGYPIVPSDVLYAYDGPLIFVAKMGVADALFYKIEASAGDNLFLVTIVRDKSLQLLSDGALSLRGALANQQYWIVETDRNLRVKQHWTAERDDLPSDFLPEAGLTLSQGSPRAKDTIEQALAFFAMRFSGSALVPKELKFSTFKSIVNDAYDSARKILFPLSQLGNRRGILDFTMAQPVFGSLVIAINDPVVADGLKRKLDIDSQEIEQQIFRNRDIFFQLIDELVRLCRQQNNLSPAVAAERFDVLDQISGILPTFDGKISELEFDSGGHGAGASVVLIEADVGERLRAAHREAETHPITERGAIIEINNSSNTFILMSTRGRQVTCVPEVQAFAALQKDNNFRIGSLVTGRGKLVKRYRRDKLIVFGVPTVRRQDGDAG